MPLPVELRCWDAEFRGVSFSLDLSRFVAARVSKHTAREDHDLVIKGVEVRVPPGRIKDVSKGVGDRLCSILRELEVDHCPSGGLIVGGIVDRVALNPGQGEGIAFQLLPRADALGTDIVRWHRTSWLREGHSVTLADDRSSLLQVLHSVLRQPGQVTPPRQTANRWPAWLP